MEDKYLSTIDNKQPNFLTKVVKDDKEIYSFIINDERINRNGWKTISSGVDLKNYNSNPLVFFNHYTKDFPIGTATVELDGKKLIAHINFSESTPLALTVKKLIDEGVLKFTSIGIQPTGEIEIAELPKKDIGKFKDWWGENRTKYQIFHTSELYEISIVNIPANVGAKKIKRKVASAFSDGILSANDMELIERYNLIENTVNEETNISKEPVMDDKTKDFEAQLTVKNDKITSLQDELQSKNDTLNEANSKVSQLENDNNNLKTELENKNSEIDKLLSEASKTEINNLLAGFQREGKLEPNKVESKAKLLIHLKNSNEELYNEEIENLKNTSPKVDNLGIKADDVQQPSNASYGTVDGEEVLISKATELSKKEGIDFEEALNKLVEAE